MVFFAEEAENAGFLHDFDFFGKNARAERCIRAGFSAISR